MEYYSAFKKKEILPFVITWMNLKDIMLSDILDKERQIFYDFAYYVESKNAKLTKTESKIMVTKLGVGGGRSRNMLFKGTNLD